MSAANDLLTDAVGRVGESVPAVLDGLSPDDASWRPDPGANSIGWLVWHLSRVLDSHVADTSGRDQVADAQGFEVRLGLDLPPGDTGYGHGPTEVAAVHVEDVDVLADYYAAVAEVATAYLREVDDLDRVVDENWDPPVTLGVRLVSIMDELARHIGQAEYVKGLLQRRA